MSNIALLALGGVAATSLAKSAAQAVSNGVSFATELAKSFQPGAEDPASAQQAARDGMRLEHEVRIAEFAARVRRNLEAAGIDVSEPLALTSDGLGGIAIAGDHPQRAAIEDLLAGDVLLQRDFQRLAREREAVALELNNGMLSDNLVVSISKSEEKEVTTEGGTL
jgi:hypothetical protein